MSAGIGPPTVLRAIVPVIVNAVKRQPKRPVSHVFQKYLKIIPSFTNGYSAAAVPLIGGVIRVVTSLSHTFPDVVLGSPVGPGGITMGRIRCAGSFIAKAPARLRISRTERSTLYNFFCSAFTNAVPEGIFLFSLMKRGYGPTTANTTSHVDRHRFNIPHFMTRWKWW